ncbi:MAG: hypothetical protein BWY82_01951 [Verrucomicrobia bacterium ADurb.Bin474]|nr:MAG: hypothetical protein BWY82_01951 [Verrucomicrobia bacterium ADurb.Bin474]
MDPYEDYAQRPIRHFKLNADREAAAVFGVPFGPLFVFFVKGICSGSLCCLLVSRFEENDVFDLLAPKFVAQILKKFLRAWVESENVFLTINCKERLGVFTLK